MKILLSTTIIVGFILSAGVFQARETSALQSLVTLNELMPIQLKIKGERGHSHTFTKHSAHHHHHKDRVGQGKQRLGTKKDGHLKAHIEHHKKLHPAIQHRGHQHKKHEHAHSRVQRPTAGKKK